MHSRGDNLPRGYANVRNVDLSGCILCARAVESGSIMFCMRPSEDLSRFVVFQVCDESGDCLGMI